jgi:nicotinamidase/pyrazinamidase
MNALIIVDIQNDFLPGGSLTVPGGDDIIALVNSLQTSFNLVVATQDWHPQQHKSFASNHDKGKLFEVIGLEGLEQVLWPDHCVQGTIGADFHKALDTKKIEAIFRKGMEHGIDSYSGFYDNGYRKATGLAGYLRERKVQKVFVCGLAADYCVYYTAKDALKENFQTYIIEDATRAINNDSFQKAKDELMSAGGNVIKSELLHRYL